jgi:RNA polymerase sigma-70 factor (ECF subfamily)
VEELSRRYPRAADARFRARAAANGGSQPDELDAAIAAARDGDSLAVSYLYERFAGAVYRYIRRRVRDDRDAEDLTQQVFTRVLPALSSFEQRGAPFGSWLLRVAHNVTIDHLRRRALAPPPAERVDGPDERRGQELSGVLLDALDALPPSQREVVVLRHVVGLEPSEIAARLGTTEASVNGLSHRGRRALRAILSDAGAGPMAV